MSACDLDTSVPDWIIEHPETLTVFLDFGIDYSCGGKSLGYLCDQHGLDQEVLLAALRSKIEASGVPPDNALNHTGEGGHNP